MTTPRPTRRRITRDTVAFTFGLGGIAWMLGTGQVHVPLVVLFGLLVGGPTVASVLALLLGAPGGQPGGTGTTSPLPSQVPPESAPRSESSSAA